MKAALRHRIERVQSAVKTIGECFGDPSKHKEMEAALIELEAGSSELDYYIHRNYEVYTRKEAS